MRGESVIAAVLLLPFCCTDSAARTTTPQQAELLVKGWLAADPQPLDAVLGRQVSDVEIFTDTAGQPLYYVVHLEPLGLAIVSADDLVEPIVGFTSSSIYDPSPDSPLAAMIAADLTARIGAARASTHDPIAAQGISDTQSKWYRFIELAESRRGTITASAINTSSLSDLRIAPLIRSNWSQGDVCSENPRHCFNYYTPNNYGCGCVATAMAQLIRYHEHPTEGIGRHKFTIKVEIEGNEEAAYTRGGDGAGGPYMWRDMVLDPNCSITETQCQAIGALCYDAGVSINMHYNMNADHGSGTSVAKIRYALTKTFQYSNAIVCGNGDEEIGRGLTDMINPNLDAGCPVILGLRHDSSGHAVVADGYGYDAGTLYHHINVGWREADDVWYSLPLVKGYNVVSTCIYNILVDGSGEIVSGRATDTAGNPIESAAVTAQGPAGPYRTSTNSRGIYAFPKLPSNSYFVITAEKAGYMFEPQITGTATSYDNELLSGNRWNVDFVGDISGDWNGDDVVNLVDLATFALAWRSRPPDDAWNTQYDISNPPDYRIDALDLASFADKWLARASNVVPVDPGTKGLVAYYPLSGNVLDDTPNDHDGDPCGTPTYVEGPAGCGTAMEFRNKGDSVYLGTFNPSEETGEITVALWAKWNGLNGEWQGLIAKRDTKWDANDMMWQMLINKDNGGLSFHRAGSQPFDGDPVLPVGEWAHVAATFDGVVATLYLNGEKTGSGLFTFGSDTEARVQFGDCTSDAKDPFKGVLDEVRLYSRALSHGEVAWLAGRTAPYTNGLVACYPLSHNVQDASGNSHHGTVAGTPDYVDGPVGYGTAMRFGGAGNYVDLGMFNPSVGTGKITVALWAKWEGRNGQRQGLIGKCDTQGVDDMMWEIGIDRGANIPSMDGGGIRLSSGDVELPIGEWTHVAVTFDGVTGRFYVDGERTGSGPFGFGPGTRAPVQFGDCSPEGTNPFNGALDEVRIYNQALPQKEIGLLAGRTELHTLGLVAYYPLSGNVLDATGNGHDGDPCGTPNYVEGYAGYGTAMQFGEDYSDCNSVDLGTFNPSAGTGRITVALWAKWKGLNGNYQGLIGKRDTWNAADMMWQIQANGKTGSLGFHRQGSVPYVGDPCLPVGEWAHVAAAFDGVVATFYVDGEKTGSGLFTLGSDTGARVQFGDCTHEGSYPFNGALDEIRIYNWALPQSEIGWLAGKTTPAPP